MPSRRERDHANALLALQALEASGRWATAWPRLVHQLRMATAERAAARRTVRRTVRARVGPIPTPDPPSAPASPSHPARAKTIVDGKPTADHPGNQGRPRLPTASS